MKSGELPVVGTLLVRFVVVNPTTFDESCAHGRCKPNVIKCDRSILPVSLKPADANAAVTPMSRIEVPGSLLPFSQFIKRIFSSSIKLLKAVSLTYQSVERYVDVL